MERAKGAHKFEQGVNEDDGMLVRVIGFKGGKLKRSREGCHANG